jgi:hypothetical protein
MRGGALVAVAAVAALAATTFGASPAHAQTNVLLQGIADGEFWSTDTMSTFLRRNDGNPGVMGRLQLWGALEPTRGLVFYAYAFGEQGAACATPETELEQAGVRYTASRRLVVDAGKITSLVGEFASRRFSTRNPLIGEPDAYPVQYPTGVQVSGVAKIVDYAVAMVDLPFYHAGYTPAPTRAWRPSARLGITPFIGVRLGAAFTQGPYLNDRFSAADLAQKDWDSYQQRITALDLKLSAGFFELYSEAGWSRYDVPQRGTVDGMAYYVEGKYTFTPRLFVATRLERNDYPFINNFGGFWVANRTDFHNEEYGVGYRVSASTLLKASYRRDTWQVNPSNASFVRPGGKALAVQLSQSFDVMDWVDRARLR